MAKILKKVQLSTEQSTPMSADPMKGTQENPYSQEEFAAVPDGAWKGGYVEGAGYVAPASRGSYPDTGNVLYPGIYVDAGRFQADHQPYNGVELEVRVWWTSGYTGNINYYSDPDWFASGIRADTTPRVSNSVVAYWEKVSDGVYRGAVALKASDAENVPPAFEFTMEELESGHKP